MFGAVHLFLTVSLYMYRALRDTGKIQVLIIFLMLTVKMLDQHFFIIFFFSGEIVISSV